ncbi:molecular chaperone TorD [Gallibacterium salpingitidis]|uniref:Chaperone protein TorD n=1 Tax=Gallibacterium salpingitidis TaxID=505341 RepID=A0A1A7NWI4_9PAST|nr:molecular chaperone TorD [Gallibacterium salpingitidis]OBW93359.1 hypothetical protein QS62_07495 [Gallibacterium salpingitidis]
MMQLSTQERLFLYTWLNSLLSQELSQQQLLAYQTGTFDDLFCFLTNQGFAEEIIELKQVLRDLSNDKFAYLELAADFAQLFLLDSTISAVPYASVYLDKEVLEQHLQYLDHLLASFHLQLNQDLKEPADHLCVHLELLIKLIEQRSIDEQELFIRQHILVWFELLLEKIGQIQTKFHFYQPLLKILHHLLLKDAGLI